MTASRAENTNDRLIERSIELIRSFNPTTHSIDSHIEDNLGTPARYTNKSADTFVQQVVYGCFKEKATLNAFINLFYDENAASVSRADITLYTVLAYLAIYRLKEMRFSRFKEICKTQDPSKVSSLCQYLFDREILYSSIRSAWMSVIDLTYVEDVMIKNLERFMPDAQKYIGELTQAGNALAEAEAAKEAAKASGSAGMKAATAKPLTRPRSPNLSRPRAPILREPEEIKNTFDVKDVPGYLNRRTMATLADEGRERSEKTRAETISKYSDKLVPKFHETKGGRSKLDIAQELEEARTKDLQFNASYYHPPPEQTKNSAKVRLNVASILREDYLFRQQQAKDVKTLEEYEENLRDPTEFYMWQKEMENYDHIAKLRQVAERREQAKQSSEEAALAFKMMQDGNKEIASIVRKQGEAIVKRKEVEKEILLLTRRETVAATADVRDVAPGVAVEKVREQRVRAGKELREDLKAAAEIKMKEREEEELQKVDRIRQLKAVNSIHKKSIKVFDPTEVCGPVFLDQMSYMEMKERQVQVADKARVTELNKREELQEQRQKRAKDLEQRALSIEKLRRVKRESNTQSRANKITLEREKEAREAKVREESALHLRDELRENRERAAAEKKALQDEQDRVKRQQQYLGAGKGAVEESRNMSLQAAAERKIKAQQREVRENLEKMDEVKGKMRADKELVAKQARREHAARQAEIDKEVLADKRRSVQKLKESILAKKAMVQMGREQFNRTKQVTIETNRYAQRINEEIHDKTLAARTRK